MLRKNAEGSIAPRRARLATWIVALSLVPLPELGFAQQQEDPVNAVTRSFRNFFTILLGGNPTTKPVGDVLVALLGGSGGTGGSGGSGGGGGGQAGERPRVVSAISQGNTIVVVGFSKAMADSATIPGNYSIVQESVNPEVGALGVTAAEFTDSRRLNVKLTTRSQNEVTYRVRVSGVTDTFGQPLADQQPFGVDPTSATFAGTANTGPLVDSDGDGLGDDEEQLGWTVTIRLADGTTARREVTSSPDDPDSDADGLDDRTEKSLGADPRDDDSDDDTLPDYAEYNEFFSDPIAQDTDGDGLADGLEVDFFRTSAILPDTDGDQIPDGQEINLANRNPRVADLPKPALEIGEMSLRLDVRFLEVTSRETKEIENRSTTASLTQSESQEFSTSESNTIEAGTQLSQTAGFELSISAGSSGGGIDKKFNFSTTSQQSFSNTFVSNWGEASKQETQDAYQESLETTAEISEGSSVTREVRGASAQVAVVLKTAGNIAFTIRNLQITALIQDPQDSKRLTPVATLLPDAEPAGGFNLGPLVPERGPILFSNDQVFPNLIEDLMRNPRGLVFRFSNYDVTDELGRNFAFTSQDITDRTGAITIDFGGSDENGDGVGDGTEIHRVATGTGRDVDVDPDPDVEEIRRIVFDASGRQVGISLRDALRSIGLTEYDEEATPSVTLPPSERRRSYSIRRFTDPEGNVIERIYRVRMTAVQPDKPTAWEILLPEGIDRAIGLDDLTVSPGSNVTIAFLQDIDGDRLPAVLESIHSCSDGRKDTDGDGLDDRFEVLVGWEVRTDRGSRRVTSRCSSPDTDRDGVDTDGDGVLDFGSDAQEAPGLLERDADGLIRFPSDGDPTAIGPRRDTSMAENPEDPLETALLDPITDPTSPDTDRDGVPDSKELAGYSICEFGKTCPPEATLFVRTNPEAFDTDLDTASDGVEERLGGNPLVDDFAAFGDSDGDGIVNVQETSGWEITIKKRSFMPQRCDSVCDEGLIATFHVRSDPFNPDTDGDGLGDGEEFVLGTNPEHTPAGRDVDGDGDLDTKGTDTDLDGLTDAEESLGYVHPEYGILVTDPLDADSDNDKLTDGFEAERFQRRIIRVPGETPYRAFSRPDDPDTDLDRLVDGDELRFRDDGTQAGEGSDPRLANTDGDFVLDYDEAIRGSRPVVPDFLVNLIFRGFEIPEDCDFEMGEGEFYWDLSFLRNGQAVLRHAADNGRDPAAGKIFGIPMSIGYGIFASANFGISTTPALYEELVLSGFVTEEDDGFPDVTQFYPNDNADPSGRFPGNGFEFGYHRYRIENTIANRGDCKFFVDLSLESR